MALIPPHYLNNVISIGSLKSNNDELLFASTATGFLIGRKTGESNEMGPLYRLFLVTNRHVFENTKTEEKLRQVCFRFNKVDGGGHHFIVNLLNEKDEPIWFKHDDSRVDVAVLPIVPKAIDDAEVVKSFFTEEEIFLAKEFKDENISTGDSLFVLGFPMGISGKTQNFVIVRNGIIARVDDEVLEEGYYYIDASAYPGNSGGPVIHKPETIAISGTNSNNSSKVMGMVSSGETYSDVAISRQTGQEKIVFTEQTGLVRVVPMERVLEIIDAVMAKKVEAAVATEVSSEDVK